MFSFKYLKSVVLVALLSLIVVPDAFGQARKIGDGNDGPECKNLLEEDKEVPSELHATISELLEWQKTVAAVPHITEKKFGTTIYSMPVADPLKGFPDVSVTTKAILIFFPGAGTERGSGRNAMRTAASLRKYGVTVLSLDWPYHGQGPRDEKYYQGTEFKKILFSMIKHYRRSGLPIFIAGHSFGSIIAQEILYDSPKLVEGAIMMSPGGYQTPGLLARYKEFVSSGELDKLAEDQNVVWNSEGNEWVGGDDANGGISKDLKSIWSADRINTPVPVMVLAGDRDPWSSSDLLKELANRFPIHELVMLKGLGHHEVFTARGEKDVLMIEKLLEFMGQVQKTKFSVLVDDDDTPEKLRFYTENSPLFRRWFAQKRKPIRVYLKAGVRSRQLLEEWYSWLSLEVRSMVDQATRVVDVAALQAFPQYSRLQKVLKKSAEKGINPDEVDVLIHYLAYFEKMNRR